MTNTKNGFESPLYEQLGAPTVIYYTERLPRGNRGDDLPLLRSEPEFNHSTIALGRSTFGMKVYKEVQNIDAGIKKGKYKKDRDEIVKGKIPSSLDPNVWHDALGSSDHVMRASMIGRRACGNCLQCITDCAGGYKLIIWAGRNTNERDFSNRNGSYYNSVLHCARMVFPSDYLNEENEPGNNYCAIGNDEHVCFDICCHIQQIVCCSYNFGQGVAILIRTESNGIRLLHCSIDVLSDNSSRRSSHREMSILSLTLELLPIPTFPQPIKLIDCFVFCSYAMSPVFTILCEERNKNGRQFIRQIYFDDYLDEETDDSYFIRHAAWRDSNMHCIERSFHPSCLLASASMIRSGENYLNFIDLRSPRKIEQRWSADNENFLRQHLITDQILHHPSQNNTLYVSVCSEFIDRVYEMDYRMPAKILTTWSLPMSGNPVTSLDSRIGDVVSYLTFADWGDISNSTRPDTVLSIKKTGGVRGLCMYQPPITKPLFETHPLETGCSPRIPDSSIAVTSFWPVSDAESFCDQFLCGLSSVRVDCPRILPNTGNTNDAPNCWGYDIQPTHVLCVMILNSYGDIYCHSLLECNPSEERKSIACEGLPAGTRSLALPNHQLVSVTNDQNKSLQINLSNLFTTAAHCKMEQAFSRDLIKPFEEIDLDTVLLEQKNEEEKLDFKMNYNDETEPEQLMRIDQIQSSSRISSLPKVLSEPTNGEGIALSEKLVTISMPKDLNFNFNQEEIQESSNIDLPLSLITSLEKSFHDLSTSNLSTNNDDEQHENLSFSQESSFRSGRSERAINFVRTVKRI